MKLKLEFQYFEGCPNHKKMSDNLEEAIKDLSDKVELTKVHVKDKKAARQVGFRGSPTLLIDGEDLEGIPTPKDASLSCIFYPKGVPSSLEIKNKIQEKLNWS
jgi:hypothetical protein